MNSPQLPNLERSGCLCALSPVPGTWFAFSQHWGTHPASTTSTREGVQGQRAGKDPAGDLDGRRGRLPHAPQRTNETHWILQFPPVVHLWPQQMVVWSHFWTQSLVLWPSSPPRLPCKAQFCLFSVSYFVQRRLIRELVGQEVRRGGGRQGVLDICLSQ